MDAESAVAALAGAGMTAFLAKVLITRSLRELEQIAVTMAQIQATLSAITAKIELIEKDRSMLLLHDRKIAAMENQVYGKRKRDFVPAN